MSSSLQTYAQINWIEEAARVAKAFGVVGECEFAAMNSGAYYLFCGNTSRLPLPGPMRGKAEYTDKYRYYNCDLEENSIYYWASIRIGPEGIQGVRRCADSRCANELARVLSHLDLLTIEVEAALGVSISAHEKLEWAREYDRKYGVTL